MSDFLARLAAVPDEPTFDFDPQSTQFELDGEEIFFLKEKVDRRDQLLALCTEWINGQQHGSRCMKRAISVDEWTPKECTCGRDALLAKLREMEK